jgi:hypothetical protein
MTRCGAIDKCVSRVREPALGRVCASHALEPAESQVVPRPIATELESRGDELEPRLDDHRVVVGRRPSYLDPRRQPEDQRTRRCAAHVGDGRDCRATSRSMGGRSEAGSGRDRDRSEARPGGSSSPSGVGLHSSAAFTGPDARRLLETPIPQTPWSLDRRVVGSMGDACGREYGRRCPNVRVRGIANGR